jgi:hypothetical protein
MIRQIKHETGHVQFRMLRELLIGQNSLHLSGSTPALAPTLFQASKRYPGEILSGAVMGKLKFAKSKGCQICLNGSASGWKLQTDEAMETRSQRLTIWAAQ